MSEVTELDVLKRYIAGVIVDFSGDLSPELTDRIANHLTEKGYTRPLSSGVGGGTNTPSPLVLNIDSLPINECIQDTLVTLKVGKGYMILNTDEASLKIKEMLKKQFGTPKDCGGKKVTEEQIDYILKPYIYDQHRSEAVKAIMDRLEEK